MTDTMARGLERGSEWLNAILIREVRRALNGRVFVILYLLLLLICALLTLGQGVSGTRIGGAGWMVYGTLYSTFAAIAFGGLPLMGSTLLHTEVKEKTLELVSITAVSAARILWGELQTMLVLFLLLASAVVPFMAFSYLLGGVDLLTIGTGIGVIFLGTLLLTLFALMGAVQQKGHVGTLLANLVLGGWLWGMASWFLMNPFGGFSLHSFWDDPNAVGITAGTLASTLSLGGIFFTVAMARLTYESANRSGPVRLAVLAHIAAVALHIGLSGLGGDRDAWAFWVTYSFCLLFLLGIVAVGEEERLTRRQLRTGPLRRRIPVLWAMFLPGASRGLMMIAFTGLLLLAGAGSVANLGFLPVIMFLYVMIFLGATRAVSRLHRTLQRPLGRRLTLFSLILISLLLPLMIAMTTNQDLDDRPFVAALSPFLYLSLALDRSSFVDASGGGVLAFLSLFALAVLIANARFVLRGLAEGSRLLTPGGPDSRTAPVPGGEAQT